MGAMIDKPPDGLGVVLRVLGRGPDRLLATTAAVGTANHSPTMTPWGFEDRPTAIFSVLQRGIDFLRAYPDNPGTAITPTSRLSGRRSTDGRVGACEGVAHTG